MTTLFVEIGRHDCPYCHGIVTVGGDETNYVIIHTEPICMNMDKLIKGFAIGAGVTAVGLAIKSAMSEKSEFKTAPGLKSSETHIAKLHESIQPLARDLIQRAYNVGLDLVVTNGFRSNAEQERLYNQGRTTPGPIVTKAKPGTSWHNHGLAFDVAVRGPNGQATWPNDTALWKRIGSVGKTIGLRWGGDFDGFTDNPHFEYHPSMTIADAMAGKRPAIA